MARKVGAMNDRASTAMATQPMSCDCRTPMRATSIPPGIPNTAASSRGRDSSRPAAKRLIP